MPCCEGVLSRRAGAGGTDRCFDGDDPGTVACENEGFDRRVVGQLAELAPGDRVPDADSPWPSWAVANHRPSPLNASRLTGASRDEIGQQSAGAGAPKPRDATGAARDDPRAGRVEQQRMRRAVSVELEVDLPPDGERLGQIGPIEARIGAQLPDPYAAICRRDRRTRAFPAVSRGGEGSGATHLVPGPSGTSSNASCGSSIVCQNPQMRPVAVCGQKRCIAGTERQAIRARLAG